MDRVLPMEWLEEYHNTFRAFYRFVSSCCRALPLMALRKRLGKKYPATLRLPTTTPYIRKRTAAMPTPVTPLCQTYVHFHSRLLSPHRCPRPCPRLSPQDADELFRLICYVNAYMKNARCMKDQNQNNITSQAREDICSRACDFVLLGPIM